jgi:hypothetical protein
MAGRWVKQGLLTAGPPALDGAMVPFLDAQDRLYVSARDADGRSSTVRARLTTQADGTMRIDPFEERPVLEPGALGAFDDSGAMGACLVEDGDRALLFYIGWMRGVTVPFYTSIGLAVGDGETFQRVSAAPILGRSSDDPFFTTSPWVLRDGGTWRMWYTSCEGWTPTSGRPHHAYNIRYAESDDGVAWRTTGRRCINFRNADEYAIARPCVRRDGDLYRMWYSYRGERYRIGYAESDDGLSWVRRDELAGIDVGPEAWDADMIEYPYVFERHGRQHLLYNGDAYGMTGAGHALWEPEPS